MEFGEETLFNNKIHIYVKQRTIRSYITTIKGIPQEIKLEKLLKLLKTKFNCNGNIKDGAIQIQGKYNMMLVEYLDTLKIASKEDIILHGVN